MQAIVDTNVFVSAFLTPGGTCHRVLLALRAGRFTLVCSDRIVEEYGEVLRRPHLRIDPELISETLTLIESECLRVSDGAAPNDALPDPDDAVFIALARRLGCPVVTGNMRDYPAALGVRAVLPAQWLELLAGA